MIKSRYQATPAYDQQLPPVSGASRERSAIKNEQSYLSNYARDNLVNGMRSQQTLEGLPSGQRGQGVDLSHRASMQMMQMGGRELSLDDSAEGRVRSLSPVMNNGPQAQNSGMRGVN